MLLALAELASNGCNERNTPRRKRPRRNTLSDHLADRKTLLGHTLNARDQARLSLGVVLMLWLSSEIGGGHDGPLSAPLAILWVLYDSLFNGT